MATGPQATLTVQLAQQTTVRTVDVTRGSTSSFGYSVQTSTDGTNWQYVATAPTNSTGTDHFTFASTRAKFVRLEFPGGGGAGAPEIDEVSVS